MPHRGASGLILLFAVLPAAPANAVVLGAASSLGGYTVRLIGNGYCSGVVIARRIVATAAHCAHGMRVVADGGSLRVIGVSRSAQLDDGRRVAYQATAPSCTLPNRCLTAAPRRSAPAAATASPLPATAPPTSARGAFGSLHEAILAAAGARALASIRLAFCRSVERATALRRAPPRGPLLAC